MGQIDEMLRVVSITGVDHTPASRCGQAEGNGLRRVIHRRRVDANLLEAHTVGFIRKLPPQLVASFRATLADIVDAAGNNLPFRPTVCLELRTRRSTRYVTLASESPKTTSGRFLTPFIPPSRLEKARGLA